MAGNTSRPLVFTTPYSAITEDVPGDDDVAAGNGCFGLCVPGAPTTWASSKFKKMKEFSEVIAGPKWKNFIRKIGKLCNPRKNSDEAAQLFRYSPESYGLNFAGGDGGKEEDDQGLMHSFSARFANHANFANMK